MKRGSSGGHLRQYIRVILVCLAILAFGSVVKAETIITANLTVTPSPTAKPGAVLKFQADIIYNPKFDEPAGTRMRICVVRSDFSWVSDKLDIEYPGMGSVHVNFNNGFTIPANAKTGQVFDFYLTYGPWWVLSNKASVKVLYVKPTFGTKTPIKNKSK